MAEQTEKNGVNEKKSSALKVFLAVAGKGCLLVVLIIIGIAVVAASKRQRAIEDYVAKQEANERESVKAMSAIKTTPAEFKKAAAILNVKSLTELQYEEAQKQATTQFIGKKVEWTASLKEVENTVGGPVNEYQVVLETDCGLNIYIRYPQNEFPSSISEIAKGKKVRVSGLIDSAHYRPQRQVASDDQAPFGVELKFGEVVSLQESEPSGGEPVPVD